jgi:uncharacterized Fe-S radical SAM superfamily protein PflX
MQAGQRPQNESMHTLTAHKLTLRRAVLPGQVAKLHSELATFLQEQLQSGIVLDVNNLAWLW